MQKWEVLRVFCDFLVVPHDKFCICLCPDRLWFFFFNTNPPQFRKAREFAVRVESFEAIFLTHTSFVDTTTVERVDGRLVATAMEQSDRRHGTLSPNLQAKIIYAAQSHGALNEEELAVILD